MEDGRRKLGFGLVEGAGKCGKGSCKVEGIDMQPYVPPGGARRMMMMMINYDSNSVKFAMLCLDKACQFHQGKLSSEHNKLKC